MKMSKNYIMVVVVQLSKYTKNMGLIPFKWVSFMVHKLYFKQSY